MYRIYSDNMPVYDPLRPEYTILAGQLEAELNKAGSLTFTMPQSNAHYGMLRLKKSIVTLYDDDRLVFRGRPYAPNRNLYQDNEITCEGELAFFNDTYQKPFEHSGTVKDLFVKTIEAHNAQVSAEKQFKVGVVDVVNDTEEGNIVRSSIDYMTTWDFLKDKFFESELGGYLWVRHEQDGVYIDYRKDLSFLSEQTVEQCINLIDAKEEVTTDELATVVVPLGAKLEDEEGNQTDEYTTIASVNDGKEYIEDAEGVEEYGRIVKIVTHDDITDPTNLLKAARKDLADAIGTNINIELEAADLSKAGYEVKPFSLGTYADVKISNLGVDGKMLIRKVNINLLAPESSTLSVGESRRSFTSDMNGTLDSIGSIKNDLTGEMRDQSQLIVELRREVTSQLEQTAENIMSTVTEAYYNKEDTDELLSMLQTQFEQTAEGFYFRFEEFQKELDEVSGSSDAGFNEIKKYINFVDGNIILGTSESSMTLRIENDTIGFYVGEERIAWWDNRVFHVERLEAEQSLRLGKFEFQPRSTGNLSFLKVVD